MAIVKRSRGAVVCGKHSEQLAGTRDEGRRLNRERARCEHYLPALVIEKRIAFDVLHDGALPIFHRGPACRHAVVDRIEILQERLGKSPLDNDFQVAGGGVQQLNVAHVSSCHGNRGVENVAEQSDHIAVGG